MSGTTQRYSISYPTGDNLVSELPSLMQNMCVSIDTALAQVDDRNNVGGVKPLVRRTLAELRTLQGVTGQTGYVQTGDGAGVYHFTGTQWQAVAPEVQHATMSIPYTNGSSITLIKLGRLIVASGVIYARSNATVTAQRVNESIPDGFRPSTGTLPALHAIGNDGSTFYLELHPEGYVELTGNMHANARYGFNGMWVAD